MNLISLKKGVIIIANISVYVNNQISYLLIIYSLNKLKMDFKIESKRLNKSIRMRKFFILLGMVLCYTVIGQNPISQSNQTPYYYYYQGQKLYLNLNTQGFYLDANGNFSKNQLDSQNLPNYTVENEPELVNGELYKWSKIELQSQLTEAEYFEKLTNVKLASTDVNLVQPSFSTMGGDVLYMSSYFYVKLNQASDLALLQQEANTKNVLIIGQNQFMPLWYTLRLTSQTNDNTLNISNYFYDTGLFSAAEPDFIFDNYLDCSNDTNFGDLWGLSNSNNPNIDINICDAWNITEGNGIKVAVVDTGTELTHQDLSTNIGNSYDTQSNSSPSQIYTQDGSYHGTHVSGTVAAVKDNNLQVVGVSPQSQLMPISVLFGVNQSVANLAEGINWAWQNGADVINNSWGGGSPSNLISDAILNAINNGRNGKGCIVVFSTSNNNSSVSYPANSNENILAVGSITSSGSRSSFSNYGNSLDVVAPGSNILSTFLNNNVSYLSGTSMAAPHVSGIAALILSANPDLSIFEVNDIIESTAQKVGNYNYGNSSNRPNGTWDDEMGYGLVDAFAAVQLAQQFGCQLTTDLVITGPETLCEGGVATYYANYEADWSVSTSAYTITSGSQNRSWITVEPSVDFDPTSQVPSEYSGYIVAEFQNCEASKFVRCTLPKFSLGYNENSTVKVSLEDVVNSIPISEQGITQVQWELTSGEATILTATDNYADITNGNFTGTVTLTNNVGTKALPFFWPDIDACYMLIKTGPDRYQVIDRCNFNEVVTSMTSREIYDFSGNKIGDIPINYQDLDITNMGQSGDFQVIVINVDGEQINELIIKD